MIVRLVSSDPRSGREHVSGAIATSDEDAPAPLTRRDREQGEDGYRPH